MIRLLSDRSEIDAVFTHPDVRGEMGSIPGWDGLDLSGCRVWGFDGPGGDIGGAFLIVPCEGGASIHVAILPEARGRIGVEAGKEVIAREGKLFGRTPKARPEAFQYAILAGMRYVGEDEREWFTEGN